MKANNIVFDRIRRKKVSNEHSLNEAKLKRIAKEQFTKGVLHYWEESKRRDEQRRIS